MAKTSDDSLKKPNIKDNYSKIKIEQLARCMTDPIYFAENFVKIQHTTKGAIPFKPFDYQKEMITAFNNNKYVVALTSRQNGKALDLNTPILTPNGFAKMGELNVGDIIYGKNGKQTKITFITDTMYDHDCYNIEFTHGENIIADKEHLWNIINCGVTNTYDTAKIYELFKSNKTFYIETSDIIEFDKVIHNAYDIGRQISQKNISLSNDLIFTSSQSRLSIIQGMMECNGYVHNSTYYYDDEKTAIDKFRLLLSTMGIKSFISDKTIYFKTDLEIFKNKKYTVEADNRFYIKNISKVESSPVRCLQVDADDHLFLCGHTLIPTHNTTCAAAYLLWQAMFVPDSTILIVANLFAQAMEIVDRIKYAYEYLPDYIRAGVKEYNKSKITFDNDSRIIARATTSNAGRGLSVSYLYCDEFSFVRPNIQKDFWAAIQPVLATGGRCIITSTPKSDEDQFAEIWRGANDNTDDYGNIINETGAGRNGFYPVKSYWYDHPDRDEEWARPFKESLGKKFYQEFECVTADTVIDLKSNKPFSITMGDLYSRLSSQ